jgi:hypothetical protein
MGLVKRGKRTKYEGNNFTRTDINSSVLFMWAGHVACFYSGAVKHIPAHIL